MNWILLRVLRSTYIITIREIQAHRVSLLGRRRGKDLRLFTASRLVIHNQMLENLPKSKYGLQFRHAQMYLVVSSSEEYKMSFAVSTQEMSFQRVMIKKNAMR